jgi:hypothetical protein
VVCELGWKSKILMDAMDSGYGLLKLGQALVWCQSRAINNGHRFLPVPWIELSLNYASGQPSIRL